ncbi:MAG: hypothetical protein ABI668_04195 [Sphingorhabdus sp.]
MADPEFSPEVCKALDSYIVPALPAGFADRLLARIEAGDTATVTPAASFASRFRRKGASGSNAWRRSGRILGAVAFLSLATATAAAAGLFGDPVYMPGISEALAKAELVPLKQNVVKSEPTALAAKTLPEPALAATEPPASGTEAIVSRLSEMRTDPAYSNLTPRERLAIARKEVRTMIRSGEATPQEARAAVRELARTADPATRAQVRETIQARRQARLERTGRMAPAATVDATPVEADPMVATAEPESEVPVTEELPAVADSGLSPEKIDALREKYSAASPEQRAQIRQFLRERRSSRLQRRTQ